MKLLVMDVEGTLFKATMKIDGTDYPSTMWQPIAYALGEAAMEEERRSHEKWDNLEYKNYMEWVKATIDIHKKYSLRKETFDSLIQKAEYSEGVVEFFNRLNRTEWVPVLISGGFQNLIRRAQNELDIEYGFGACEYHFDDYGYLESYNLQPSDFDGKTKFIDNLIREFKLNKKTDWVFIGDGKNDEPIAKQAPLAFGMNAHEKLKAIDGLVEITSFLEILPYLEKIETQKGKEKATTMPTAKMIKKSENDVEELHQRIFKLKADLKIARDKKNEREIKTEQQFRNKSIKISDIDYEKTPRQSLHELMRGLRITFIGLDENCATFRRLSKIKGLKVISGVDKNFNVDSLKYTDFIFYYKNHAAHSVIWRSITQTAGIPYCYLGEPTKQELLENAMANVLYRYVYN